ncbi:MAG TPA: hypothetical protein VLC10_01690, partial [Patescibacteria group bacterium]|nr:hypothetical protein [Patescibacteria group bacterium]
MSLRPASSRRRFGVLRAAAAAALAIPFFAFYATAASAITALSPFTATVTSPTGGATVTGVTTLVAHVSDPATSGHFSVSSLTGAGGIISVTATQDAVDPSTWSASWDSTAAANGSASVTFNAVRTSDGTPSESAAVLFSVDNAAPALTVSVTSPAALATLTGTAALQASTNVSADSLTFVITPVTGGSPVTAQASGRSGNTAWAAAWDSTAVPNGSYGVIARAFQGGSFTDSLSVAVSVQNAVVAPALAVSIGTPASGTAVTGIITIAATTNVVASSATFAIRDAAGVLVATLPATSADGLAWTAIWDSTAVVNGSFKLRAHATQDGT